MKNYWLEPEIKGRPPWPRYQHAMRHMPRLNLLVIHGGRTSQNIKITKEEKLQNFLNNESFSGKDSDVQDTQINSFTLGDIYALKLDNFEWIRIKSSCEGKLARSNHWMVKISNESLLIFGGNAVNSTYWSSDYIITFTDEKYVRRSSYHSIHE